MINITVNTSQVAVAIEVPWYETNVSTTHDVNERKHHFILFDNNGNQRSMFTKTDDGQVFTIKRIVYDTYDPVEPLVVNLDLNCPAHVYINMFNHHPTQVKTIFAELVKWVPDFFTRENIDGCIDHGIDFYESSHRFSNDIDNYTRHDISLSQDTYHVPCTPFEGNVEGGNVNFISACLDHPTLDKLRLITDKAVNYVFNDTWDGWDGTEQTFRLFEAALENVDKKYMIWKTTVIQPFIYKNEVIVRFLEKHCVFEDGRSTVVPGANDGVDEKPDDEHESDDERESGDEHEISYKKKIAQLEQIIIEKDRELLHYKIEKTCGRH
jgi:hypothetical protein